MAFRVEFSRSVEKDLRGLPRQITEQALWVVHNEIAANPYHAGVPLKGKFRKLWKYRVGSYRIIYTIEKERLVVLILRIRHRKDVYRGLAGG